MIIENIEATKMPIWLFVSIGAVLIMFEGTTEVVYAAAVS
jgi:hypothetical protein